MCRIIFLRRRHGIEIVAAGKNSAISLLCSRCEGILAAPGLNNTVFRTAWSPHLVPTDHYFMVPADNFLNPKSEILLQFLIILQVVNAHKFPDFRVCVPLFSIYLVAADVKVMVWKKAAHFTDKLVEKLVRLLPRRVHCGIENSPPALNLVWAWRTRKVGIPDKPGSAVSRHIKFGNNSNAAISCVLDEVANLGLRVIQSVGTHSD